MLAPFYLVISISYVIGGWLLAVSDRADRNLDFCWYDLTAPIASLLCHFKYGTIIEVIGVIFEGGFEVSFGLGMAGERALTMSFRT
jgi:hypothetical protein